MATKSLDQAWLLYQMQRYAQAEKIVFEVLRQDPNNAQAHSYLALIKGRLKCLPEARALAEKAIDLAPDWGYPYYVKAHLCIWSNAHAAARDAIQEALRLNPNEADFHRLLSVIHAERQEWSNALVAANQALTLEPDSADCLFQCGFCLYGEGTWDESEQYFHRALEGNPEHAEAHGYLGQLRLKRSDIQGAMHHFKMALNKRPDWDEAQEGWRETIRARYWFYGIPAGILRSLELRRELLVLLVLSCVVSNLGNVILRLFSQRRFPPFLETSIITLGVLLVLGIFVALALRGYLSVVSQILLLVNEEVRRATDRSGQTFGALLVLTLLTLVVSVYFLTVANNTKIAIYGAVLTTLSFILMISVKKTVTWFRVLIWLVALVLAGVVVSTFF